MPLAIECLVLGLGNVLCSDDGLGVFAVHQLQQRFRAPEGLHILDGGTLGLALLPTLQDSERVLLLDAVALPGARPGSPVRLAGAQVPPAVRERLSPHQVGVSDLLDAAILLGRSPATIALLGLVPESLKTGIGLSPSLMREFEGFIERAVAELTALGYPLEPRAGARATHPIWPHAC